MKASPILSIIIPVYNAERYIEGTVGCVLDRHRGDDYEVILVNDGSADRSGELCDGLSVKYSCVSVYHQTNKGAAAARNTGLKYACGKYVTFIDADDKIAENTYETNIEFLELHPEVGVLQYPFIQDYGSSKESLNESPAGYSSTYEELLVDTFSCRFSHSVCDKIFRRDIISSLRFREGAICEDILFGLSTIGQHPVVYYSDRGMYYYYYVDNSVSRKAYSPERWSAWLGALVKKYRMGDGCSAVDPYRGKNFLSIMYVYCHLLKSLGARRSDEFDGAVAACQPKWSAISRSQGVSVMKRGVLYIISLLGTRRFANLYNLLR